MSSRSGWRRPGTSVGLRRLVGAAALTAILLCAGLAIGQAPAGGAGSLLHGPYVNGVSETQAKVHFVSSPGAKADCKVTGGAEEADGIKVQLSASPVTEQEATAQTAVVTGLKAGRSYKYVVTCGADRAEGAFQTAPPAGSREGFTFITYSDTQTNPSRHKAVAAAIAREPVPAFVVITGDLTDDGPDWPGWKEQFFDPARDLLRRSAVWTLRGNHERNGVIFKDLFHLFEGSPVYSFDFGNLHVACLEQYKEKGSSLRQDEELAQVAEALDKDLSATKAKWKIVCYHEGTFNVAAHGSAWARETVLPVMVKHGVDIVLCGHSHVFERFVPIGPKGAKPIIHIVSGGGGGNSYPSSPSPILATTYSGLHYCVWTVSGDKLQLTAKTPEGKIIDTFSLTKAGGVYQKEIMDQAIATEEAAPLMKVFKVLRTEVPHMPKAGAPIEATLSAGSFPAGASITIRTAQDGNWAVKETTFQADGGPVKLSVTPPGGVKLGTNCAFAPGLDVEVSIALRQHRWSAPSVPVILTPDCLEKLVPEPTPVDVPPAPAGISIDGNLADWAGVPFLHLPSKGSASKALRLAWGEAGLYGALTAEAKEIKSGGRRPWQGDSLELNLEPDCFRRIGASSEGGASKLFLYPVLGQDGGPAGTMKAFGPRSRKMFEKAAWQKTAAGYTMEFLLSAKDLSPAKMVAGRKLGFHFILRRDEEDFVEQFADTTNVSTTWASPIYWGAIKLAEK